jgi:ABC-type nitrate/sulfonate/bicarbonate transport system permease component
MPHRLFPLVPLLVAGLIWEGISRFNLVNRIFFPPPSEILYFLLQDLASGELFFHIGVSLQRAFTGFAVAATLSIPFGILLGWKRWLYKIFEPLVESLRPIPGLALIAPSILFFGIGDLTNIFVVTYGCFFVMLINAIYGVYGVDRVMMLSMRSMSASEKDIFRKLVLPSALPYVFAGMRQAVSVMLIIVVGSEMIISSAGLGYYLLEAERTFKYHYMYGTLLVLAALGYGLNRGFLLVEERLLRWTKET